MGPTSWPLSWAGQHRANLESRSAADAGKPRCYGGQLLPLALASSPIPSKALLAFWSGGGRAEGGKPSATFPFPLSSSGDFSGIMA